MALKSRSERWPLTRIKVLTMITAILIFGSHLVSPPTARWICQRKTGPTRVRAARARVLLQRMCLIYEVSLFLDVMNKKIKIKHMRRNPAVSMSYSAASCFQTSIVRGDYWCGVWRLLLAAAPAVGISYLGGSLLRSWGKLPLTTMETLTHNTLHYIGDQASFDTPTAPTTTKIRGQRHTMRGKLWQSGIRK